MNVSTSTFLTKRRTLRRDNDIEEENAALLQLGDEFQTRQVNHHGEEEGLMALNLSEARLVIREALHERKAFFAQQNSTTGSTNSNTTTTTAAGSGSGSGSGTDISGSDTKDENDIFNNEQSLEQELQNIDRTLEYAYMGGQSSGSDSGAGSGSGVGGGGGFSTGSNQALKQTLVYLANFSRFRDPETVTAVAQLLRGATLGSAELHPFEIAQLGSISCEDADEAKTLIPSLNNKINDDDLERILKELNNLETLY